MQISAEALRDALTMYVVTDRSWLKPGENLKQVVRQSLEGGATFVQLREKDLDDAAVLKEAQDLKALCREYGVPFVVDDRVDLAKAAGCDGVHVGQSDMAAARARAMLGGDAILGVSAGTVDEALEAEACGADYLGVGAVFPTGSKADAEAVSLSTLKAICQAVDIPVIAIGGISRQNVAQLAGCGLAGIAVISAVFAAPDIRQATMDLAAATRTMLGEDDHVLG